MEKNNLTKEGLGRSYMIGTVRLHELISEFYENLFDDDGNPREDPGNIANMVSGIRVVMNEELDLISEASYQYFESNYNDKSKQEKILFSNRKGSRGSV